MNGEEFRLGLHSGRRMYGTAVSSASSTYLAMARGVGLDWIFIDNEHSTIGRESTAWLCRSYAAAGISPVVRIPAQEPFLATMAMDGGAHAVIVPYTEDPAMVKEMVGAVKLRPLKGQKLRELLDGGPGLDERTSPYLAERNKHASLIINVESVPALERLDELFSVEGLDGIIIGPHDLSVSLGIPEQYDHPDFVDACKKIISTARAHGLGAGAHVWFSIERQLQFIREAGANLIAWSSDVDLIRNALRRDLTALREGAGDFEVAAAEVEEVV